MLHFKKYMAEINGCFLEFLSGLMEMKGGILFRWLRGTITETNGLTQQAAASQPARKPGLTPPPLPPHSLADRICLHHSKAQLPINDAMKRCDSKRRATDRGVILL